MKKRERERRRNYNVRVVRREGRKASTDSRKEKRKSIPREERGSGKVYIDRYKKKEKATRPSVQTLKKALMTFSIVETATPSCSCFRKQKENRLPSEPSVHWKGRAPPQKKKKSATCDGTHRGHRESDSKEPTLSGLGNLGSRESSVGRELHIFHQRTKQTVSQQPFPSPQGQARRVRNSKLARTGKGKKVLNSRRLQGKREPCCQRGKSTVRP